MEMYAGQNKARNDETRKNGVAFSFSWSWLEEIRFRLPGVGKKKGKANQYGPVHNGNNVP